MPCGPPRAGGGSRAAARAARSRSPAVRRTRLRLRLDRVPDDDTEVHDGDLQREHQKDEPHASPTSADFPGGGPPNLVAPAQKSMYPEGASAVGGSTPRESSTSPGTGSRRRRARSATSTSSRAEPGTERAPAHQPSRARPRARARCLRCRSGDRADVAAGERVRDASPHSVRRACSSSTGGRRCGRSRTRPRRSRQDRRAPHPRRSDLRCAGERQQRRHRHQAAPGIEHIRDRLDRIGHRSPTRRIAPHRVEQLRPDTLPLRTARMNRQARNQSSPRVHAEANPATPASSSAT